MKSTLGLLAVVPLAVLFGSPTVEPTPRAGPVVENVLPTPNVISAEATAPVVITFDRPVDPSTVHDKTVMVFGRWSGVAKGQFTFARGGREVRFLPDRPFAAGERVMISLARTIASPDGSTLAAGYAWSFWVKAKRGSLDLISLGQRTTRRPGEAHIQTYGAYAGDLNGDGFSDLAVPNELSNDIRIFFNDGRGDYRDFTVLNYPAGSVPSPNEGADFNGDGFIDFAVGNAGNSFVSVFIGDGEGGFRHSGNHVAGRAVRGVCLLDLDGDAVVDIATANMRGTGRRGRGNVSRLRNDGTGHFTSLGNIETNARAGKTCAPADVNGDGITDLLVGAYGSSEVVVFLGDGDGGLSYHTKVRAGGQPWMIGAGDVNGDGNIDVLSANRRGNNLAVLFGDGAGNFGAPTTYSVGEEPLAVDLGDVDGDGDLDVITSNIVGKNFTLYENAGDGTFINPRTLAASAGGSCAIIHDRDNDGDLDITGVDEIDDVLLLFENR